MAPPSKKKRIESKRFEQTMVDMLKTQIEYIFKNLTQWMYDNNEKDKDDEIFYKECEKVQQLAKRYSSSEILGVLVNYLNELEGVEAAVQFANVLFASGLCDIKYDNPYPLIALLYKKAGLDTQKDCVRNEKQMFGDGNIFWSCAVTLSKKSGFYHGYTDQYEPFDDTRFLRELTSLKEKCF